MKKKIIISAGEWPLMHKCVIRELNSILRRVNRMEPIANFEPGQRELLEQFLLDDIEHIEALPDSYSCAPRWGQSVYFMDTGMLQADFDAPARLIRFVRSACLIENLIRETKRAFINPYQRQH